MAEGERLVHELREGETGEGAGLLQEVPSAAGTEHPRVPQPETVNHPAHYGGHDNPYEAIKVIEAWQLGFNLGNTVKYIARAGRKTTGIPYVIEDLRKARWYLDREIQNLEKS